MKTRKLKAKELKTVIENRGRKLSPEEKIRMAEAEKKISEMEVGKNEFFDYNRNFRNRISAHVCRIENKEFSVYSPNGKKIIIVTRLK